MIVVLALIAFPLVFFLPGYVSARALFGDTRELSAGEKLFIPIAASILVSTWFGLILAEFGWFSLPALLALVVAYSALVWFVHNTSPLTKSKIPEAQRRGGGQRGVAEWSLRGWRPDGVFIAILALGAMLAARPAESILGNTDAGVYVNTGAHIARTGAIAVHDALVQSLPYDPGRQFFMDLINPNFIYKQVRLAGFFIADPSQGLVLPQFLHLYPVWLAIFDATLGLREGLIATPVIGLLGSIAAYFVARTLFGQWAARLAFFLLVINVPQFWFARYPVAEAMTQFLVLTGMYAFLRSPALSLRGEEHTGAGFPLLAGASFGAIWLTRADSILLLAPLGAYAIWIRLARQWKREHWLFFISFGLILAHALAHIWVFAQTYIYFQYTHFARMKNLDKNELLLLAAALAGIVALALADYLAPRVGPTLLARVQRYETPTRWLGIALMLALFAFAYFIWPRPETAYAYVGGETPLDRSANLIKLGWYLSPFGLALALLGGGRVIRRDLNRHNAFFFGTAALFAVFYLEELYSNPHYIYTTRHYVPLVIPLFILLAARAVKFLWRELPRAQPRIAVRSRALAGTLLALWLAYNLYVMGIVDGSRVNGFALRLPFVSEPVRVGPLRLEPFENSIVGQAELAGAFDQVQALAGQFSRDAVIIFSNNRDEPALVATPLYFLYDRDALVARFNQPSGEKIAALIDGWRAQGREVIFAYGTNGGKLALPRYSLERVGDFALDVPQWAFSYQYMPRGAWRINLNYTLYRAVPQTTPITYPFAIDFSRDDYPNLVNGFLERPTGASTRWIGLIPENLDERPDPPYLSATLRLPLADSDSNSATLDLAIRARAPQDGMRLSVKSGNASFGEVILSRQFSAYHFTLRRADLRRDGDTFFLDLVTSAYADPDGRVLGAELQSAVVNSH